MVGDLLVPALGAVSSVFGYFYTGVFGNGNYDGNSVGGSVYRQDQR